MHPDPIPYLAGMIDADGYVTVHRSVRANRVYVAPQVGIAGTVPAPHHLAASLWGGNVNRYVPKNPTHRPQYQWTRQGGSAALVIEAIRPYLLIKRQQADLALELWEHMLHGRCDDPYPWMPPGYDPTVVHEALCAEVRALNQPRSRGREYPTTAGAPA